MGSEVPIGRRNLLADKVKFLVAVGGVTLAVMLMLVIQSLYQGVKRDAASFVRSLPGDAWVAQKGFGDLVVSNSFLTERHADDVRTVSGVTAVHRLYGRLTSLQVDGDEASVYLWAMDPGGTLTPEERRVLPEPGTIFIDRTFAKQEGVSRGDVLEYEGNDLAVAKVGHVGNLLFARFAFIHPED
jgi:putative ABC transport system permease protein